MNLKKGEHLGERREDSTTRRITNEECHHPDVGENKSNMKGGEKYEDHK